MSTLLSPVVSQLWTGIHKVAPHALNGGSVPNLATELPHSYHRSWDDSPHDRGYSVTNWGDRTFPGNERRCRKFACALDVTFHDPVAMAKHTAYLHTLAVQRSPLLYGLREFAGTLDGVNVFAWDLTRHVRTYGWDSSHLWHIHLSFDRRLVLDRRLLAIAQAFRTPVTSKPRLELAQRFVNMPDDGQTQQRLIIGGSDTLTMRQAA